ncbi:MAG: RagB/SusD family nutrient uptake outer membrane protein [Prevotellaceae bacterium]|nr:RagB/SusD family nutrient uptake outer membrane protein [Prevotellaceae bacterium]
MLKNIVKIKHIVMGGVLAVFGLTSCGDYLDVVPDDGNADLESAFHLRSTAIRYLSTCYGYMTGEGASGSDPAMLGSDEFCDTYTRSISNTSARMPITFSNMLRYGQKAGTPYGDEWDWMYRGIRCCDIFMDNVHMVPDLGEIERKRWIAEARTLKAYYHFNLIRKYGPIPVVAKSMSMDASVEDVRVYRNDIDSCFNFVLHQLTEAIPDLPLEVDINEYGRITQPIAAALRARVAVYAASPLFNGNADFKNLVDKKGLQLFPNKTEDQKLQRWQEAVDYCKEAIDICQEAGKRMYDAPEVYEIMPDTLRREIKIRGAMTAGWTTEKIWGQTNADREQQRVWQMLVMPNIQYRAGITSAGPLSCYAFLGVPLKICDMFYTKHGLPMASDNTWVSADNMNLRQGDESHKYYIQQDYTTVQYNFDREPRFYADLGFDGGKWLGALPSYNIDDPNDVYYVENLFAQIHGKTNNETGTPTGYYPKKTIPRVARIGSSGSNVSWNWYPYPLIRLADLYLLYAEAINEAEGPNGAHSQDMFDYVDSVRIRAGIPKVKEAWDSQYSKAPGKYNTQIGMREIIRQERGIELCFESQRFWDLRRWMTAAEEYAKGQYGYTVTGATPEDYYKKLLIFETPFVQRDYFWPINTTNMERNPNLVQNLGW